MAEIDLSALARQCLHRRLGNSLTVQREVAVWERQCNRQHTKINWQFTTTNARIKFRRLYPAYDG